MSLLEQFLASPCQEVFMQLTKQDLLQLAKHYNLSDVKASFKKQHIVNIIVEYLIQQEIFDDTASILIKEDDTMFKWLHSSIISIWVAETSNADRERKKRNGIKKAKIEKWEWMRGDSIQT